MEGQVVNGIFVEVMAPRIGLSTALKVEEILYHKKSSFQDVMVFKAEGMGTVLVLDGAVQCTEYDEFSYQEMLAWVPLMCHPKPESVLIIGGGDGGVLREVTKHECVQSVVLCEVDADVVAVSKKYLPFMSVGFDSPKCQVNIGDGFAFLADNPVRFDVIICDLSDPSGPAERLYSEEFYCLVRGSLKEGGIAAFQGESLWVLPDVVVHMVSSSRRHFPSVQYGTMNVPTYPGGQIGILVCGQDRSLDFSEPHTHLTSDDRKRFGLRYYNGFVHKAAFTLPEKFRQMLADDDS